MKLIDLHKKWCERGSIGYGLFETLSGIGYKRALDKMIPDRQQIRFIDKRKSYTPVLQTIVLLICAMNDEL